MAELVKNELTKKCDLKFHALPARYNGEVTLKYKKNFFSIYVDKNNSVWDIRRTEIKSWKFVDVKGKKTKVPDEIESVRDVNLFNKFKGNPVDIAINKIKSEIDVLELLSLIYFNLNYF